MKRVLIVNGPNLNLLGFREESIYGGRSLEEINKGLEKTAAGKGIELSFFQSNSEGSIIDRLHQSIGKQDFIILNAGALTHYSYSLRDAVVSIKIPVIEVHLSNIFKREEWRQKSVISEVAAGIICGFGDKGYALALEYISWL
jgi:3-dehydroquinate dehydratase II